ncbi:arsenate reductase (glutaredoxin) [Roseobacter sp. GAI101]|uniref:arsenate reductase (glutaredoxin) n=1 Tax=Roseobacter sp. (strain GAI101) TaxID=391589 RepID=UPI000187140C|nr:arsenate reductase (glutaredoxin) [Roseobacter sp. GAI101]EEB85923.1 arsenate reductase [Roseobacter sp. GAI101]
MITLWHNPRCSKSRQTLALIEASGTKVKIRRYLEDAPSLAELEAARSALGLSPIAMMRTGEARFKELGLRKDSDDALLMQAMADAPILIERPIAFKGTKAVIGRPPEAVNALLSD